MNGHLLQERRDYIEKKLLAEGRIRVADLAKYFNVSSETIRKDLIYLEKKGVAKKGYGGAVIASEFHEPSFVEKTSKYQQEKNSIARETIKQLSDGMVIMMDAGSTVYTVARIMHEKKNVSVFTNSLKSAGILDDSKVKTYILGGEIRNNSNAIIGGWAIKSIGEINADIAILGTSGFNERSGPCVENFPEAEIKRAMIKSAKKIIVVGDSSKANENAMIEYTPWESVDIFITDKFLDDETFKVLSTKTKVIRA